MAALGERVRQHGFSNGPAFRRIGIEQTIRHFAVHHRGKRPAEVCSVDESEAHALATERRMNMRFIAGEQHSTSAIRIDKPRVVGPTVAAFECCDTNIRAADTAEHRFDLVARHRSLPIFRRATEVEHD